MYKLFMVMDKEGNFYMVGNFVSQVDDFVVQVKMCKNFIFNKFISVLYEEYFFDVLLFLGKVK